MQPTNPSRGWITNPFANKWYWLFAGLPPAFLSTILIFMDQQITAVIVNRKENKLNVTAAALIFGFLLSYFSFNSLVVIQN